VEEVAALRSFLAVELSREIEEGIRRIQEKLKRRVEGVRWVRPEGIHLTLKFLGEIDPDRIEEIVDKAQQAVKGIGPFEIRIKGGGGFPNTKNPRVIWLGVEDQEGLLRELQARVEKGLEELGFKREERNYTPHLTLGRLRTGRGKGGVAQAIKDIGDSDLGAMKIREIVLFQSQLKPSGAEYTKLRTIPLEDRGNPPARDQRDRG